MSRIAKRYNTLPSDAGITFEGFEKTVIPSRESVRKKLDEFIAVCKTSRQPTLRVLLGEWGEGKTDAYRRYIQPTLKSGGNLSFFVSASTIANGYSLPELTRLLETTSLSASKFLVILFNSIREESKIKEIPKPAEFTDAQMYLEETFKAVLGGKKKKIVVFIDEFEELLTNKESLNRIISGIKETINGRFDGIDEGGRFEGCLHLVIAATPDAFYQLQVKQDTALIFGGLGRRGSQIEIPQVSPEEGVRFLFDLLKYSYDYKLPPQLPIESMGIFDTMYRITQGNPGNLVSLFSKLMVSASVDEKTMAVIDSEHFLRFLEKEHGFVYGLSTSYVDHESLMRILRILEDRKQVKLGQACSRLFKLILGQLKPFNIKLIKEYIPDHDIPNLISIINEDLRLRENIGRTIIRVSPLKDGMDFENVVKAFKDYLTVKDDRKFVKIEGYSEPLEELEARVVYVESVDHKLVRKIFLPSERNSIASFFEGISPETAKELENLVNKKLCDDDEAYYIVSEEVLRQVYPTPVPRELEFITDREVRMKLWKDVSKNLTENFEKYMPQALVRLLDVARSVKSEDIGAKLQYKRTKYAKLSFGDYQVNTLLFSVNGDLKAADVEEVHTLIKTTQPPIHCVFAIYTGEKTSEAEDKISNKELGSSGNNYIIEFSIHPTLAKRIISIYRAMLEYPADIREDILTAVVNRVVSQEVDIETKLKDWLKVHKEKGRVIPDFSLKSTPNIRRFADTLRFFINFMSVQDTIKTIYDKNRNELLSFTRYEAKAGLIPDMEFPEFSRIVEELVEYGYLVQTGSKCVLRDHVVEKEISRLLEKKTRLTEEDIATYFVFKNIRHLTDVFMPILDYKGKITYDGKYVVLTDKQTLASEVANVYDKLSESLRLQKYQNYGFVYMTKERGSRFVSVQEFHKYVTTLYEDAQEATLNDEQRLQKLSLVKRLCEHFREEFVPFFDKAKEECDKLVLASSTYVSEMRQTLDDIRDECTKWLKLEFKTEEIGEYQEIEKLNKQIYDFSKADSHTIEKLVNDTLRNDNTAEKTFHHKNEASNALYFNPKLFSMNNVNSKLSTIQGTCNVHIERIQRTLDELNGRKEELNGQLRNLDINSDCSLAPDIRNKLTSLSENLLADRPPLIRQTINLSDIEKSLRDGKSQILEELGVLSTSVSALNLLAEEEASFLAQLEAAISMQEHVTKIFDIDVVKNSLDEFAETLKKIQEKYSTLVKQVEVKFSTDLPKKLKTVQTAISELASEIEDDAKPKIQALWTNYSNDLTQLIGSANDILTLISKRHSVDKSTFDPDLQTLAKYANIESVSEVNVKLSEMEKIKKQAKSKFYDIIKPVVEPRDLSVLELIVKALKQKGGAWIAEKEIEKVAEKELGMSSNEMSEIIQRLVERGFFKKGVSLTF